MSPATRDHNASCSPLGQSVEAVGHNRPDEAGLSGSTVAWSTDDPVDDQEDERVDTACFEVDGECCRADRVEESKVAGQELH